MTPRGDGGGASVLCRYFFQQTLAEDSGAPAEHYSSSLLLSSEPTLAELRRKFPFAGQFHFRLQYATGTSSSSSGSTNSSNHSKAAYCWLDLREPHRVLPVAAAPQREIRVKVLQLSPEDAPDDEELRALEQVDVPEDQQFDAYFRAQHPPRETYGHQQQQHGPHFHPNPHQHQPHHAQDVTSVLSGVKKALASKMKQSVVAQSIQKTSAKMWEKVVSGGGSGGAGGGSANAPPTAAALAQLAKLVGALKAPLHEGSREHVEMLNRLWVACFDEQPFALRGAGWDRLGLNYGDPVRELQFALPLHCLVFFHEVHHSVALAMLREQSAANPASYPYAIAGAQVAFLLADLLQLKDGGCLGSERPFWRLFEDPIAFFELFSIAFRAFDQSWRMDASASTDIGFHLNYVADFAQELLRRSPEIVPVLVEYAHQMQNW